MSENGISFYIIPTSDPHGSEYIDDHYKSREYMSGFTGSAGILVVSMDEAALFVDGRYHIQADKETESSCITVYKLGVNGVPTASEYIKDKITDSQIIGFDGKVMMHATAESIAEKTGRDLCTGFNVECDLAGEVLKDRPKASSNRVIMLDDSISGECTEEKIAKVQKYLTDKCADALFLSALDDICYLFNIRGRDISFSSVAFSYAYITKDSATLYLKKDAFDENMVKCFEEKGVFVADYNDIEIELSKIKGKTILTDCEYTSAYFFKVLSLGNEIIRIKNYEAVKKHVKNETEQALVRRHAVYDAKALTEFIAELKSRLADGEKITEYMASEILTEQRKNAKDFYGLSFENIVAYGENAAIVHYSADENESALIEEKGLLLVDSGSLYMGSTTDVTRTFVLGELTNEERRAYTLVLKGNLKLMDAVFIKGTRCENLDILARESLWKEGLDYRHGTGHGIGAFLNVHEGPYRIGYKIREDMPQPDIEPGMIISDEPGYYEQGKFGIRLETQLLCVKKEESEYGEFYGFEPLSLVPFEKDAIVFEMLNSEELNILKRYSSYIAEKVRPQLSEKGRIWFDYNTNFVD